MISKDSTPAPPMMSEKLWQYLSHFGRLLHFQSGQTIYCQNNASEGIFCIESGRVKVSQILDDGTEAIFAQFSKYCMFGEASALGGNIGNPMAVALTPVTVLLIPTYRIQELLTNPEFAWFLSNTLVHKLSAINRQLSAIAGQRVLCRLSSTLLLLDYYGIPRDETQTWFLVTHAELASLIGTTRSNVTVLLNRLSQQNLVEQKRNRLRILDPGELNKLI